MNAVSSIAEKKGWSITNADDFDSLPNPEEKNQGFVYALDFGECIKIGRTKELSQRIKTLVLNTRNCSTVMPERVAFSLSHSNYVKNEAVLHKFFKDKRIGNSELFDLSLDVFFELVPILTFEKDLPVEGDINSLLDEFLRQDWEARTGVPFELYLDYEKAKTPEEKSEAQKKILSAQPTIITPSEEIPSIHDIEIFDFYKNEIVLKDGSIHKMTGALSFFRRYGGKITCSEKLNGNRPNSDLP